MTAGFGPTGSRGFLFDLNACTGCNACELACSTENGLDWGETWRQVRTFNEARHPGIPSYHLSLACNHCRQAPCLTQCPALAIRRDDQTGAVLIDPEKCIGCGYCSWVCPYDAPVFNSDSKVMTKCTGCSHRLADGLPPACAERCPTGALGFGSLVGEEIVDGFPATPAQPAIRFRGLTHAPVRTTCHPEEGRFSQAVFANAPERRSISLRSEWPLFCFTLLTSGAVGWWIASSLGAPMLPALFLSLLALATVTSTLHLGRKERAWRAVLNLRSSWLSREIAGFGGFSLAAVLVLFIGVEDPRAIVGCALLGVGTLFCIDRVYDPVRPKEHQTLHSADTLMTAFLLASLLASLTTAFVSIGALKLFLYVDRRRRQGWQNSPSRGAVWGVVRCFGGLVVPAAFLLAGGPSDLRLLVPMLCIGETLDRFEFYEGLSRVSPRSEIDRTLRAALMGPFPVKTE